MKVGSIDRRLVSVGCNRSPGALAWLHNEPSQPDLIAFAGTSTVAIASGALGSIKATFRGHASSSMVNCVSWLNCSHSPEEENMFRVVSGASDGAIIVWSFDPSTFEYRIEARLSGHKGSISSLSTLRCVIEGAPQDLIASASSDGTVRIWSSTNGGSWQCDQIIDSEQSSSSVRIPLASALVCFGDRVYLAIGGVRAHIQIFARSSRDGSFIQAAVLKGHSDWVRSLDFCIADDGACLLASASQDACVRLWRFVLGSTGDLAPEEKQEEQTKEFRFVDLGNQGYLIVQEEEVCVKITLESVLSGHENWVMSVQWQPPISSDSDANHQPMTLLSSSIDRSMLVWSYDPESDLWLVASRVGEVGGHSIGCYGAAFGPRGRRFVGHAYNGSLHMWTVDDTNMQTQLVPSGHTSAVAGIAWGHQGRYLISAGEDKAVRLFAEWSSATSPSQQGMFFEIARPQIHGYEMSFVAAIPSVAHRFVSGAQEKVLRVFDAPKSFLRDLDTLSPCARLSSRKEDVEIERAESARVPELGLSNKAERLCLNEAEPSQKSRSRSCPPCETELMQETLWPEVTKLYGHGYDVFAVACSSSGLLLASSCTSKDRVHSSILLWDTQSWRKTQELEVHNLTVSALAFSNDERHLLSVSRDRSIAISSRVEKDGSFELEWTMPKAHARIVWACSWTPDDRFFATGSRDKHVKVWRRSSQGSSAEWMVDSQMTFESAVTALSFAALPCSRGYLLAVALENGLIKMRFADSVDESLEWEDAGSINESECHNGRVRQVQWRPLDSSTDDHLMLASAGDDGCVRIFDISVQE